MRMNVDLKLSTMTKSIGAARKKPGDQKPVVPEPKLVAITYLFKFLFALKILHVSARVVKRKAKDPPYRSRCSLSPAEKMDLVAESVLSAVFETREVPVAENHENEIGIRIFFAFE